MLLRFRPARLPLRIRLTFWYTFALGLILALFATFLYFQFRHSLIAQVDAALYLAASQALINLDAEADQLSFQSSQRNPEAIRNLRDDFVIQLRAGGGEIVDSLSNDDQVPEFFAQTPGFHTVLAEHELWRVYSQEIRAGTQTGRLQVAQELDPVIATLASLRAQLLLGLPLSLLLAGLGGFFLAGRALQPIDSITRTAQNITAGDLGRRIHYQGPADEVGRLAQTFDAMLDRLEAAFVRERRFTADAAHELRTPLTALKGRIGVTLSRSRRPVEYQETLQEMEGQVDRLIRLSNDLLLIARLDRTQLQLQVDTIALADFIGAVMDQVRPLAEAKAITLVEDVPADLSVQGDFDLLIRLFLNLLDNAVKYTPPAGRVAVTAERTDEQVSVAVHNTGPGIPAENQPHLFERFYRLEEDRARGRPGSRQGGAGLGLAIAHEIARAHGGQVMVQSEPGQGATFCVRLPAHN